MDTNGVEKEIINSYGTARVFPKGSKTKIVVVAEFATLVNARGAGIVDVANRLSKLFP